jgi:hypothetical protein
MSGGHNLEHEEIYQERPEIVKKREARNKARYQMEKAGKVHRGDGVDVDHTHPLAGGGSNDPSNWRVRSRHANRAEGDQDAGLRRKSRPI